MQTTYRMFIETEVPENELIVSRTDLKGNITYANETFARISGYEIAELIGKPHNIVAFVDKQNKALIEKPKISSFGLVSDRDDRHFSEEMENVLNSFLQNANKDLIDNKRALEHERRQVS